MPELRQNILTGKWVVVATERAVRPTHFFSSPHEESLDTKDCPFCPGNEAMTPPEVYALRLAASEPNGPGWEVRVVPNKFPAFAKGEGVRNSTSMYPRRGAEGAHEVIIHSPKHFSDISRMGEEEVEKVLRVYKNRYSFHSRQDFVRYIQIIVNHGVESGASIPHSHSQLFALPVVPPLIQEEIAGSLWHQKSRSKCALCDMVESELDAQERLITKNRHFIAFSPFAARFPFEAWIVPREHRESFEKIEEEELESMAFILKDVLSRYREKLGEVSYNYFIHTAPCDGSDYPYYHWHLETFPRTTIPGSFEAGTSMMINVTTPEECSDFLSGRSERISRGEIA